LDRLFDGKMVDNGNQVTFILGLMKKNSLFKGEGYPFLQTIFFH